jgi:ferric-dicitrate binding protein FerR (iron transport regulator)
MNESFTPIHIAELLKKHLEGTLTSAEQATLDTWIASGNGAQQVWEDINNPNVQQQEVRRMAAWNEEEALARFKAKRAPVQRTAHRVHFMRRWSWAAALVVMLGGIGWLVKMTNGVTADSVTAGRKKAADTGILPGSNKAILTIGDNAPITLASDKTGVAVGNGITYNDGTAIAGSTPNSQLPTLNSITTPRGGQYQVQLADGSKVWLNAASRIQFPAAFTGAERRVTISGEVYIEVAANAKQPFFVHTKGTEVQVLGTSFNLNTYENEATEKLTLEEGSIRVRDQHSPGKESVVLQPGEQAVAGPQKLAVAKVNVAEVTAWKNGFFNFAGANLPTIMRQLERWYDIEVVYDGAIPPFKFGGKLDRGVKLDEMLELLTRMEIKYRMKDRTLTITGL